MADHYNTPIELKSRQSVLRLVPSDTLFQGFWSPCAVEHKHRKISWNFPLSETSVFVKFVFFFLPEPVGFHVIPRPCPITRKQERKTWNKNLH